MANFLYFTPGPSQLYHTVGDHIQQALREQVPSISHRSDQFQKIVHQTKHELSQVLNLPDGYRILFTASANEIWERILQNLVIEKSHHLVNGAFSSKFYKFSQQYQLKSTEENVADGGEFTLKSISEDVELISVTINETSMGYTFDMANLEKLRKDYPAKLISADLVSATPAISFDFSLVDTAYFSVQKCFGLPSGLGVWIINERCIAAFRKKQNMELVTGSYHSLGELLTQDDKNQTPETPNMLAIYLLGKVAEDMNQRGIKMIQNETRYKSTLLYQVLEELDWITPFIKNKNNRSQTVLVGKSSSSIDFINYMKSKKIVVGKGYGSYKEDHVRIANFPAHSKEQVEMLADLMTEYGRK